LSHKNVKEASPLGQSYPLPLG